MIFYLLCQLAIVHAHQDQLDSIYSRCGYVQDNFCLRHTLPSSTRHLFTYILPAIPPTLLARYTFDLLYPSKQQFIHNNIISLISR